MKHVLVALLEDRPGVLQRVVNLFSRRAFNIDTLTVGHTEQPDISRLTLVVDSTATDIDQVVKQLYKIINVLTVGDVTQALDSRIARMRGVGTVDVVVTGRRRTAG